MRTLVSVSISGMGDRIRLLLASRELAKKLGREHLHVWPVNGHCGSPFEQLFEMNEPVVTPTDPWPNRAVIDFKAAPWSHVESTLAGYGCNEVVKFHAFRGSFPQEQFGSVVKFSKEIVLAALHFKHDRISMWGRLNSSTIGCHVRGTDYRPKTPPLTDYFCAIDAMTDQSYPEPIFLATDEDSVRSEFKIRFPDRLLLYPVRDYSRCGSVGTIDSAIELCLLRMCGHLVLSGWSEFSRLACLHQPPPYTDGVVTVANNT